MGVFGTNEQAARTTAWRFTDVNANYEYCATYPAALVVPRKISDATLNYGKSYRSKARIAGLVYLHWSNLGTITRASQPMVGLKNNRSIQDEKLVEAIFSSHSLHHSTATGDASNNSYISHSSHSHTVYGATATNLIIDARPTANAVANVAKGAGTENMEYYRNCKKVYLGIDNIHVMRDSLARVAEATRTPGPINYDLLRRSGWLKYLSCILEGIVIIVKAVHLANSHVLIHCSDGWDRTSQLSAISQLCLDPFYRTMTGFAVLIEKDWVSFGHRFLNRSGHVVSSRVQFTSTLGTTDEEEEEVGFLAAMQQKLTFSGATAAFKDTCPVFDQFLDCVHQLQLQFPDHFEFNEHFLLELQKQLYECKFGNFLYNSERERVQDDAKSKTRSIWSEILADANRSQYLNPTYSGADQEVLFPDPKNVKWWTGWFKREEMNQAPVVVSSLPAMPITVESLDDDPVLSNVLVVTANDALPSSTTTRQPASPNTQSSSLPLPLDNATINQASTVVHGAYQGAMRSAWSAWKSVKQTYEASTKERDQFDAVGPSSSGMQAVPSTSSSRSGASSPVRPATPRKAAADENLKYQPRVARAQHRPEGDTGFSVSATQQSIHVGSTENPWKTADAHADPLGVKTWS